MREEFRPKEKTINSLKDFLKLTFQQNERGGSLSAEFAGDFDQVIDPSVHRRPLTSIIDIINISGTGEQRSALE